MNDIIHTTHRPTHCQRCGTPLQQPTGPGRPRRFCSAACCLAVWLDARQPVEPLKNCVFCGSALTQPHLGRRRKFCSAVCRGRQYIEGIC